jgi:hypothetical protein
MPVCPVAVRNARRLKRCGAIVWRGGDVLAAIISSLCRDATLERARVDRPTNMRAQTIYRREANYLKKKGHVPGNTVQIQVEEVKIKAVRTPHRLFR